MVNGDDRLTQDIWERWDWLWALIFYSTILISVVLTVADTMRALPLWGFGLLTVGWIVWHTVGLQQIYQRMTAWEEAALPRFLIIVGGMLFWFVLVSGAIAFYVALFGLFVQVFRHLPSRYAIGATLLLIGLVLIEQGGVPIGLSQDGGQAYNTRGIWIFIGATTLAALFSLWISAIIRQSTERRELIDRLEAAQAELAAAERREGVLEERQRLAREIHDTLAQGFTSIFMQIEAAEQAFAQDPERLKGHLGRAKSTARTGLEEARRVVQDLRPEVLAEGSLPQAIERTAERWQAETGMPVKVLTTGNPVTLHSTAEITLLRAVQEALANIQKHAKAGAVQVTLSYLDDVVLLDVQDDGVGLANADEFPFKGGFGLQAMRERVEACGGELTLESEPDEGTTVVVSIPVSGVME